MPGHLLCIDQSEAEFYLDGGEGGGHLDHREEGGVGGGEHVEGDHAREAHQEED